MSQYKTGTVSVTTGDATVTGTNTLWLSNVTAGDSFTVAGTGATYEVASVTSDTALELTANYAGATASGQSYAITRDFTANYDIPELSQGDIETATVWTRGVRKIDSAIAGVQSGVDQAALRESLLNEATLYADFANGDYRLYEGVGSGLVRNKTFGSVFTYTRGSSATGYGVSDLETVSVDAPRFVYDSETQSRNGLLIEEARTRLNTIAASPVSPEDVTVTAVAHTISFFGTGTVTLSGAFTGSLVGTGADDRATLTFTPTAGTLTLTPSGTVENLQLEAGSFATSVILGEGTQVTRADDDCSRTLGPEFNANEGAIYFEYTANDGYGDANQIFTIDDGTTNNRITFFDDASSSSGNNNIVFDVRSSGASVASINLSPLARGEKYKIAISYSLEGGFVYKINGVGGSAALSTLPVNLDELSFGRCTLKDFRLYPEGLSAAELQALTAP